MRDVLDDHGHRRLRLERHPPGQHLVQHNPQRVNVRPRIHFHPLPLLRRHVGRSTHPYPRGGQRLRGLHHLGQAEIGEQHPAPAIHQHVAGFHVAVDDPPRVSVVQRLGYLADDLRRLARGHRLAQHVLERAGFHILGDDVAQAAFLAEVVNGQDVRMGQFGDGLRFAGEALGEALFVGEIGGQHLDRHVAVQGWLIGLVYRGHPSFANLFQNPVLSDGLSDEISHIMPPGSAFIPVALETTLLTAESAEIAEVFLKNSAFSASSAVSERGLSTGKWYYPLMTSRTAFTTSCTRKGRTSTRVGASLS